jgi:hypothetical protein
MDNSMIENLNNEELIDFLELLEVMKKEVDQKSLEFGEDGE